MKNKNTGTAQEMIDEENYFNPQTKSEKIGSFTSGVFYLIFVIIIFYILW